MRKIFSKIALAASLGLALAFTLSCGGSDGDEDVPEISSSSGGKSSSSVARSSSSLPACLVNGMCASLALEDCFAIGGQPVQSCPASSSSSLASPSSSSLVLSSGTNPSSSSARSSSSVASSSSVPMPSSSSVACSIGSTVQIGGQVWMATNLNCNVSGSKCYDDAPSHCTKYGRLYDWATALTVCPSGWHLPYRSEWNTLRNYIKSDIDCDPAETSCDAGTFLKASSGWDDYRGSGNGTDGYGFTALPGGYANSAGVFSRVGSNGYWWTASENNDNDTEGYGQRLSNEYGSLLNIENDKSVLYSVRCVKNN